MEGNQIILLLIKLLGEIFNKLSKLIGKIGMEYLKHRQKKKELGLKKGKVIKSDKIELLIAKNIKKTLGIKEKVLEEKVRVGNYKLDCYKLEMQSKLADLEKDIIILQSGVDAAKDQVSKEMLQKELHKTIREKTDFEKEVNRTLLDKNKEINALESEYKNIKENIKFCDAAIDGFDSNKARDMTESMRSNYESLVKQESMNHSKESLEHNKDLNKNEPQIKEQYKEVLHLPAPAPAEPKRSLEIKEQDKEVVDNSKTGFDKYGISVKEQYFDNDYYHGNQVSFKDSNGKTAMYDGCLSAKERGYDMEGLLKSFGMSDNAIKECRNDERIKHYFNDKSKEQLPQQNQGSTIIKENFVNEVTNEVTNEAETGIEKNVEKEFVNEVDKEFVNNHEKETEKEINKSEKSKDNDFNKQYLEKQRRKSLAKEKQKDLGMAR